MMNEFQKCVDVTDVSKVGYWKKHEAIELYQFPGGLPGFNEIVPVQPGEYAVWIQGEDGPLMDIMDEGQFDVRFVTEENLPPHLAGTLDSAPTYTEWVKLTHNQPEQI